MVSDVIIGAAANLIGTLIVILATVLGIYFRWIKNLSSDAATEGDVGDISKEVKELKQDISEIEEDVQEISNSYFGVAADEADKGHTVRTEKQFQRITDKVDEVSEQIRGIDQQNTREHREMRTILRRILQVLSDVDGINGDLPDPDDVQK